MLIQPAFLFTYFLAVGLLLILSFIPKRQGRSALQEKAGYGLWLLPAALFFGVLIRFSSDVPYSDDYNLLDTFYRMLHGPDSGSRIKAFFEQVNEHRFAFERTLMFGIYKALGYPSVKAQILTGNLFLIGIVVLLYRFFKTTALRPVYFAPVPLLAFSLLFYENSFWGIAAIQNTPLIFFALLAGEGMSRETRGGDVLALVSATVISFISGSGIAVWLIGIIVYFLQARYRTLALWVLIAAGILAFYFTFDYHLNPKDASNLFLHPVYNFIYMAAFWGNLFLGDYPHHALLRFYPDVILSVAMGTVLLAVLALWVLFTLLNRAGKTRRQYWFMLAGMLFFFATGAMLVVSRPITTNIIRGGEVFSRRYVIFGVILAACAYLACLYIFRKSTVLRRGIAGAGLGLGVLMNFGAWYFFGPVVSRLNAEVTLDPLYIRKYNAMLLTRGEKFEDRLFWNHPTAFGDLLKRLDSSGIYRLTLPEVNEALADFRWDTAGEAGTAGWKFRVWSEPEPGFNMRPNGLVTLEATPPEVATDKPVYFVIRSGGRDFVLPAMPEISGVGELLTRRQYFSGRYSYTFWKTKFPPGSYRIGVILKAADGSFLPLATGRKFRL